MSIQTLTTWTGLAMCAVIISAWTWKWLGRMQRRDALEQAERFRRNAWKGANQTGPNVILWDKDYMVVAVKPKGQPLEGFLEEHLPPGYSGKCHLTVDGDGKRFSVEVRQRYLAETKVSE